MQFCVEMGWERWNPGFMQPRKACASWAASPVHSRLPLKVQSLAFSLLLSPDVKASEYERNLTKYLVRPEKSERWESDRELRISA